MTSMPDMPTSMPDIVVPSPGEYPAKFGKEYLSVLGKNIPPQVARLYGCISCEWRGTPLCPFKFKKSKGLKLADNCHRNGICQERVNYLKSFYTGEKEKPTYLEWRECYTRAMAHLQMDKDYLRFKQLEEEIEKLEKKREKSEENMELLIKFKEAHMQYKSSWFQIMKHISQLENDVIKRDTPKKIEVDHRISLTQIHQLVDIAKEERITKEEE